MRERRDDLFWQAAISLFLLFLLFSRRPSPSFIHKLFNALNFRDLMCWIGEPGGFWFV
jgi:hypothetical protein